MIPVGAIVGAAMAMRGRRGGAPADPMAAHILIRLMVVPMLVGIALGLLHASLWIGIPAAFVVAALAFPAFTLVHVLVPLGMPRVAYYFARVSPPLAVAEELRAGGVMFAAMALHRVKDAEAHAAFADSLDMRLAEEVRPRAAGVVAHALLAAARGERETARTLFAGIEGLPWRSARRLVRRIARTWLVADAAERGDWRLAASLGYSSYFRWTRAIGAMAKRILGDADAPSDAKVRFLWLVAPHRRATRPLLLRALAARPSPLRESGEADALEEALRMRDAFLRAPTARAAVDAAHAWDAVSSGASTKARVARRALALEAKLSPEIALARLLEAAARDLAPYVCRVSSADTATSPTLRAAVEHARREELEEIEDAAKALAQRTKDQIDLHTLHEWVEYAALRRRCARAERLAGTEARRAAFKVAYHQSCNHAVWLFNGRAEKLLAHGMFAWLLAEARATNAADATIKLLEKNVKAGFGI